MSKGTEMGKMADGSVCPGGSGKGAANYTTGPGSKGGSMGSKGSDIKQGKCPSGDATKWRESGGYGSDKYASGSGGYRVKMSDGDDG